MPEAETAPEATLIAVLVRVRENTKSPKFMRSQNQGFMKK
jgi:hypothetical protein